VSDTRRGVDLLLAQPGIDPDRILTVGHSLGGKMAFLTAAADDRIKATVASDFGIGWDFTNWDAPWYFGDMIHRPDFGHALHEVLALQAPHPFLLVGGKYDKPESWQYLEAARPIYDAYGRADAVGFINHATGHRPPMWATVDGYRWVNEQFALPDRTDTLRDL